MSDTNRAVKIKFKNELGEKINDLFDTKEIVVFLPESKKLYKALSTSNDVEDWDFMDNLEVIDKNRAFIGFIEPEENNNSVPTVTTTRSRNKIHITSEIDALRLLNTYMVAAKNEELYKLGPNNEATKLYIQNEYSKMQLVSTVEIMGLKTLLEFRYSGDFNKLEEDLFLKLDLDDSWELLHESTTITNAFAKLFNK